MIIINERDHIKTCKKILFMTFITLSETVLNFKFMKEFISPIPNRVNESTVNIVTAPKMI